MRQQALTLALLGALSPPGLASSAPVIYPAHGQTVAQTDRDKLACADWSRGQSGFDPLQPTPQAAAAPAPAATTNGMNGSVVKGAAGGAAVAELTHGDAGRGAAIGVIGAGLREQIMKQQAQQQKQAQQQQQTQQQQAARAQQKAMFDRGFAACMEARGYVVK